MKSGRCPKCGSTDVRSKPGAGKYGHHGRIPSGWGLDAGVPVDRYVCVDCGFVETYVADEKHRRKIREKWPLGLRRRGE